MTAHYSVRLIPWDDREFVQTYERAAAVLASRGVALHEAAAPGELQQLIRADGYPDAVCYCERTADRILHAQARCVVARDGGNVDPATFH